VSIQKVAKLMMRSAAADRQQGHGQVAGRGLA
jgi:hypothetical protein